MATIDYHGDNGPDGSVYGKTSTSKCAFWGATPIVQPSGSGQAAVGTTAAVSGAVTSYGFTTSTQALEIITLVNAIRTALVSSGIMAGA